MTTLSSFVIVFIVMSHAEFVTLSDINQIHHFGTKSPYRLVANIEDKTFDYPGCEPSKIIGIIRHGTRTPGIKNVRQIRNILSAIQEDLDVGDKMRLLSNDEINQKEKSLLRNWAFSMDTEGEKILTREGGREMFLLAKRLQKRFPSILSNYNNNSFLFKYTRTQRTEESAKFFTRGLFGDESIWFPESQSADPVLRFYKRCKKWLKEVKKSYVSKSERDKFSKSTEMHDLLKTVSMRLGLNYTISYGTVHLMYITCSFEIAWFGTSPWCIPFNESDLKILEYGEELKYYWRDGYGFYINYRQSCPLFANIIDFIQGKIEGSRKAVFYFTHSGTILKSLAGLGLYKDDFVLTSDVDKKQREGRLWRISYIDAFGSNIVFVLYKCESEGDMIFVSHQERQIQLSGCPPPPRLCPLSTVKKLLSHDESCDFEQICSV